MNYSMPQAKQKFKKIFPTANRITTFKDSDSIIVNGCHFEEKHRAAIEKIGKIRHITNTHNTAKTPIFHLSFECSL